MKDGRLGLRHRWVTKLFLCAIDAIAPAGINRSRRTSNIPASNKQRQPPAPSPTPAHYARPFPPHRVTGTGSCPLVHLVCGRQTGICGTLKSPASNRRRTPYPRRTGGHIMYLQVQC